MNEKGEITLLTSENITPYFMFIICRVRFANQHILCNPDPKNKGTGYDYPDLLGLGNNNEKIGWPERLSTRIHFRFRNLFHGIK